MYFLIVADFWRTKCWCQQNSRGLSCDSYIYWFSLGTKFHHCRICVIDFRKGGPFCPSHLLAPLEMPIQSRVKVKNFYKILTCLKKTTIYIGLLTDQISIIHSKKNWFGNFGQGFYYITLSENYFLKFQLPAIKQFWSNFCCKEFLFVSTQKVCFGF